MTQPDPNSILRAYDASVTLHRELAGELERLIGTLLRDRRLEIHSITSRVKTRASLERKLAKPDRDYASLSDITDIVGIRIITYFADDVDRVAALVAKEFSVDEKNSIDRRSTLDPDRFGYLSLHHVAALSDGRCRLAEYRRFRGIPFEVQSRSILQHAWAEIEHDLGYKSPLAVPHEIRRRFSRLAGLLELADEEFAAIRDNLRAYESTVSSAVKNAPASVGINKASMKAFVESSATIRALDRQIAQLVGAKRTPAPADRSLELAAARFQRLGFDSVSDLEAGLKRDRRHVAAFARAWLGDSKYEELNRSIGLFYYFYVLIGSRMTEEEIGAILEQERIGHSEERRHLAKRVASTVQATYPKKRGA